MTRADWVNVASIVISLLAIAINVRTYFRIRRTDKELDVLEARLAIIRQLRQQRWRP